MQFTINRETLLKPLQLVTAVIERRQTLPILSNVFLNLQDKSLSLLGTDMEVELSGCITLEESGKDGKTTAPARKLVDICRSLPEKSELKFQQKGDKLILQCGRSRFNLATLPATDFPISEEGGNVLSEQLTFKLSQKELHSLIGATNFAMAQQDVRYYLNGTLWEIDQESFSAVATDGHRLAKSKKDIAIIDEMTASQKNSDPIQSAKDKTIFSLGNNQFIIPRKAIHELSRLLTDSDDDLTVLLSNNQLRITMQDYTFTSRLIDGKFPDYHRVIPQNGDKILSVDRDLFRDSLSRVGVLSNDKHRSVCLELKNDALRIYANNLDQEEAEDNLDVSYSGEAITIAFNLTYLLDVLNSLPEGAVKITLSSTDASVRLESIEENASIYVIMPMRL